jgi:hypothetical protein
LKEFEALSARRARRRRGRAREGLRTTAPRVHLTYAFFLQLARATLTDRTSGTDPALYRRYLTMFVDGVRADISVPPAAPAAASSRGARRR